MSGRRIGLVCPYSLDHHGGVQHHVLWLATHLRAQGDDVSVLAPGAAATAPPGVRLTSLGGAVPVPYNGSIARVNFGPATARRVRRWVDAGEFDLLHVHEPITPSIALWALAAARSPVVATFHTATPRSRTMTAAGQLLQRLIGRIDAGIAVSESARQVVVQHLGRDAVIIPNGFEVADYAAEIGDTGPWRGGNRPCVTFLGRSDEPRKGLDVLLDALPALRAARPDVQLVVAGSGRRRLPSDVSALGPVTESDKVALLARTDVFVAPHVARESFGIVLLEALASGAAVVASELPAFVDLLGSWARPNARLVPVADPAALADGVLAALSQRPGPAPRGLDRFGWARLGPQIELAYRTALACGPQRRRGDDDRTRARVSRTWPELDAALLRRSDRAGAVGVVPPPHRDREQQESRLSELLGAAGAAGAAEADDQRDELAALARRLHNDAVAVARTSRRRSEALRSFEMAEHPALRS